MKKILIRFMVAVITCLLILLDTSFIGYSNVNDLPIDKQKSKTPQEIMTPFKKGWNEYKNAVRHIETQGFSDKDSYYAKSPSGLHWGRYQLGKIARGVAGHRNITYIDFSNNPQLQEVAFHIWIKNLRGEMYPYVKKYSGTSIDGIILTESGIISMAHNVGGPETRKYLDSGGGNPPGPLKFLKLNNYNLDIE